jgi:multimeric flavodoxin WrbA
LLKILGLAGSPRRHGNSETLLDEALAAAQHKGAQTEKIAVVSKRIRPCAACNWCAEHGECKQKDYMEELYPKLAECDGLIVASPIFFYSVPAQLKAVIDRCQTAWNLKYTLKKPLRQKKRGKGVFIGVGATKGVKLFDGSVLTVKYFFDPLDIDYEGELLLRGIDAKGEIKKDPSFLEGARNLGEKLAEMIEESNRN